MFVNTSEIFSKNLVRYRKFRGLSQRELASKAKLTQRMINRYENSPVTIPVEKLDALAEALNITINDLFDEDKKSPLDELDVRWLKKLAEIRELPEADRKEINRHINSLVEKQKLKQQQQD